MVEIVNLNRVRKAKKRTEKEKSADTNRVLHGTPRALKKLGEARKNKAEQRLSGHRLEEDKDDN